MYLSDALKEVSKMYANGAVEFYTKREPNAWQDAHDKLEGAILLHRNSPEYFSRQDAACKEFVREIKKLLDIYKVLNPEQPILPSIPDAFVIGDEDRVRALQSLAAHICAICSTTEKIRVAKHPTKGSAIYCIECVK